MKDFANKADNISTLAAEGFNSISEELEKVVTSTGQTLDTSGESSPDPNTNQVKKAITAIGQISGSCSVGGSGNNFVLSQRGGVDSAFQYYDGQKLQLFSDRTTTGNVTCSYASLGIKKILGQSGAEIPSGIITSGIELQITYNSAFDGGNGAFVYAFEAQAVPVGKIDLLPFRFNELPYGWYFGNGGNVLLSSLEGQVLQSLSANFKADWGIVEGGGNISKPNLFHTDGRGFVLRAVDGTTRQVGSTEDDAIRNILGFMSLTTYATPAPTPTGAFAPSTVFGNSTTNNVQSGGAGDPTYNVNFDASSAVPTATENRMINKGMTPAIYLGV